MAEQRKQVFYNLSPLQLLQLDELCEANKRKRGDILVLLVDKAHAELQRKPTARINP